MVKVHLYIKQVRKRKAEANPLWIEAVEEFTLRQKKVVKLQEKFDDMRKVVPVLNACLLLIARIAVKRHAYELTVTLVWVNADLVLCNSHHSIGHHHIGHHYIGHHFMTI